MAFLLSCPNCGERSVMDFRFGGEINARPDRDAPHERWVQYYYFRKNTSGQWQEWWYHKFGCRRWFFAERDTRTNEVLSTFWPEDRAVRTSGDSPALELHERPSDQ